MKQLVWDLPTRLFHWALTLAILLAYAFSFTRPPSSLLFSLHVVLGVVAALLLAWRLVWGFVGSKHARWGALAVSPREIVNYLLSVVRRRGTYYAGHNPGSAAASWAMFVLIVLTIVSGVLMNAPNRTWRQVHELAPNLLLVILAFHIVGTTLATLMHKENYIKAMFTGLKRAQPEQAIAHAHSGAAIVMTAWVVLGTLYFVGGFDRTTGVFTPPGTTLALQVSERPRARRPRPPGQPGPDAIERAPIREPL
jgi:cytochrome b